MGGGVPPGFTALYITIFNKGVRRSKKLSRPLLNQRDTAHPAAPRAVEFAL